MIHIRFFAGRAHSIHFRHDAAIDHLKQYHPGPWIQYLLRCGSITLFRSTTMTGGEARLLVIELQFGGMFGQRYDLIVDRGERICSWLLWVTFGAL